MPSITLPLESTLTLRKDGTSTVKHNTFVTGEVGRAFTEAVFKLAGGSVEECIKQIDAENAKEAVNG